MIIIYKRSFEKDLLRIYDSVIFKKIEAAIRSVKSANRLLDIPNIKKITGHKFAYRIKIGEYRIGFYFVKDEIEFSRVLHRKDIYKYFPCFFVGLVVCRKKCAYRDISGSSSSKLNLKITFQSYSTQMNHLWLYFCCLPIQVCPNCVSLL